MVVVAAPTKLARAPKLPTIPPRHNIRNTVPKERFPLLLLTSIHSRKKICIPFSPSRLAYDGSKRVGKQETARAVLFTRPRARKDLPKAERLVTRTRHGGRTIG